MRNLITDVPGVKIGHAEDAKLASGVTVIRFDEPAVASGTISGGAPGSFDTALLDPDMTVERIDAVFLSGGSAFGLATGVGVQGALRAQGRGFAVGPVRVPIVTGAILFDLLNGGDKTWGRLAPYADLGFAATENATENFALGTAGAGFGATTANLKGGLGSASAVTSSGFLVGAVVAVNAIGVVTMGDSPHFWASPYEVGGEFGGLGGTSSASSGALRVRVKGDRPSTTIACVVTDAIITKPQAKRLALMANDGLSHAIRPAHAPFDGDTVFFASTGKRPLGQNGLRDITEIGTVAADCLARAVARGVFEARALPYPNALPSWRDRFGTR
ncbi:MAG: P1 family peptidase [Bosea sp. (in: a-proteobacteria)]